MDDSSLRIARFDEGEVRDLFSGRIVVFDGAMGTAIQALGLTAEDYGGPALEGCNENVTRTRPERIRGIHEAYLEAGADVVETNTFGSSRLKLDEYGLGHRTYEVNFRAAILARRAAERFSTPERPRFVAGSIGPTGMLPSSDDPTLSAITFDELSENFYQQAKALVEGGVDVSSSPPIRSVSTSDVRTRL